MLLECSSNDESIWFGKWPTKDVSYHACRRVGVNKTCVLSSAQTDAQNGERGCANDTGLKKTGGRSRGKTKILSHMGQVALIRLPLSDLKIQSVAVLLLELQDCVYRADVMVTGFVRMCQKRIRKVIQQHEMKMQTGFRMTQAIFTQAIGYQAICMIGYRMIR